MSASVILRQPTVSAKTGNPRSTLYYLIEKGEFTHPVKLGDRAVGWPESEVEQINAARISGKSKAEIVSLVKRLEADRGQN